MHYQIITGPDPQLFVEMVKEYLGKGWQLQGGVAMSRQDGITTFAQAMIKEEKDVSTTRKPATKTKKVSK